MRCEKDSASAAGFADGGRGRHANERSHLWEPEKARKQGFPGASVGTQPTDRQLNFSPVSWGPDFWPTELQDNKFLLF